MIYRLWTTRGSTEKLAQVSASVDSKYIASTEEAQKELHMFMCSGCGYTLFPARGREGAFFNEKFKCPMCGASKESGHRRRRQIEDATRGDPEVMIVCLHHKADERDVYEFFSKNAGKVRDVQIIRDARTGRSKGLAYVEFYLQEATLKALALSGQPVKGQAVRVQPSQSEKNRAAQAAKASIHYTAPRETPLRLYVGGLTDSLANISEEELKKLFSPFGEIEFIDLHRDPYTNKCKGFAFVQFKNASEAREAMTAMNGFQLAGKELKVGIATSDMQLGEGGQPANLAIGENLHEDASTMGPNAQSGSSGLLVQAGDAYAAAALSMVLHTVSPWIPTFRSDVRIFCVTAANGQESAWLGGGADLTPYYLTEARAQGSNPTRTPKRY
eukprot:g30089.t1